MSSPSPSSSMSRPIVIHGSNGGGGGGDARHGCGGGGVPRRERGRRKKTMKQLKRACLNEDIILFSILPRLPAKALSRFKCVSKNWHDSISSNPYFIHLQFQWARASPCLLFTVEEPSSVRIYGDQSSVGFPCLSDQFKTGLPMVVASCNGILGVVCFNERDSDLYVANAVEDRRPDLYVGNPVLKDWQLVPKPKHSTLLYPYALGLVVDVKELAASYKLVVPFSVDDFSASFNIYNPVTEYRFEVLSSETGSWEVSKEKIILDGNILLERRTVTVIGALYWKFGANVLRFDSKEDCSGLLPLPSDTGEIGEWDGKLSYTTINDGAIRLWIMNELSWSRMHSVPIEFIVKRNFELCLHGSQDASEKENSFEDPSSLAGEAKRIAYKGGSVFLFSIDGMAFSFDMETSKACYLGPKASWFAYKNTLISLPSP